MGNQGTLLITMLVLFAVGVGCADEPVNISMFDPEMFQIPVHSGPDHENLTIFNLIAVESKQVSGTGNLSAEIAVTDPSGDQSESVLIINGSDETSWSYSTMIYNTSPYSYTIIDLSVANAERVWAYTISSANANRDVTQSETYLEEDVTGDLFFGSAFPTDPDYSWMKGPETIMILNDISGSGDTLDVAEHYNQESGSVPRGAVNLDQIRSARAEEIAAMIDADPEDLNRTDIRDSSLNLLQTDDNYRVSLSYMSLGESGTVEYREGLCVASAEEVRSGQYIDGVTAPSLWLESIQFRDNEDWDMPGVSLSGRNVTACTYDSSNYDTGVEARFDTNFFLSADTQSRFSEGGYSGETRVIDNIRLIAPVDDSPDTSTMLSGELSLAFGDASSSLTGTYEGSAPRIVYMGDGLGKTSQGGLYCSVGDPGKSSMAALKGYVQTRGSSVSAGSASAQHLFYVDANRGVPMEWNSWAARDDDEEVTSRGSSTSGSRFIRQKAYADRSTLIAA